MTLPAVEALVTLDRRTIPWGNGGLWWPVKLHELPGDNAGLGELVTLHVMLSPGADRGPPIDRRRLSEMRVHSGAHTVPLIATHALAWQPGRTRVKVWPSRRSWHGTESAGVTSRDGFVVSGMCGDVVVPRPYAGPARLINWNTDNRFSVAQ